jgi:hypothetical protein
MEPYQHHDFASLRDAINQRNQNQEERLKVGHNLGHSGQNGTSQASDQTAAL